MSSAEQEIERSLRTAPVEKGLRPGVIGVASSFMTALASTGPALALATVAGVVIATAGSQALGIMILAAVPMLMVARSFWELDVAEPDCGTTFVWVGRSLGPFAGFLSAWGQLGACLMIVPASAFVLAQYSFALFGLDSLAASTGWTIVVGVALLAALGAVCYFGVELAARVQRILVIIEVVLVGILVVGAVVKVVTGDALAGADDFSLSWLNPFGTDHLADALVIAIFAYWGWDIAFTLSEESKGEATPGRASVFSIFALCVLYAVGVAAFLSYAGVDFITENADILLAAIGDSVLGSGVAPTLITLAVLTSALAATQATFVSGSRLLLSMGAYRALPGWFRRTNAYQSPVATIAVVAIGATLFTVMAATSQTVLFDSISSTGVMICFYYSLTVFSCAWRFRETLRFSTSHLVWRGLVPILAGLILVVVLVRSALDFADPANSGATLLGVGAVFWFGIGTLVLGLLVAIVVKFTARDFASGRTMQPDFAGSVAALDQSDHGEPR